MGWAGTGSFGHGSARRGLAVAIVALAFGVGTGAGARAASATAPAQANTPAQESGPAQATAPVPEFRRSEADVGAKNRVVAGDSPISAGMARVSTGRRYSVAGVKS